jgi:cytochrome c biogenesis protein CcmG/thiol:disulfide interchange protein DsbE
MRFLRFALPLAIFAVIGVLLYSGLGKDPRTLEVALLDKPVPAFDLPELRADGQRVTSAALLGRVYLLNVWASWCNGCQYEHPVLTEFARRGIVPVVGLNWKDERDDALRWLAQFGDPYDAIAADADGGTVIDFGVAGAPESFLVDAQGVIRYKHVGPLTPDVVEREILPRIRRLEGAAP